MGQMLPARSATAEINAYAFIRANRQGIVRKLLCLQNGRVLLCRPCGSLAQGRTIYAGGVYARRLGAVSIAVTSPFLGRGSLPATDFPQNSRGTTRQRPSPDRESATSGANEAVNRGQG